MKKVVLSLIIGLAGVMCSISSFATNDLKQSNSSTKQVDSEIVQKNGPEVVLKDTLSSPESSVLNTTNNANLSQDNIIIAENVSNIIQVTNSYIDTSMRRIINQNNIIIAKRVNNVIQLAFANMRDGQDIKFKQKNLIISSSAIKVFQCGESFPAEFEGLSIDIENTVETDMNYEEAINYIFSLLKNNNDFDCTQYNIIIADQVENVKQIISIYNNTFLPE